MVYVRKYCHLWLDDNFHAGSFSVSRIQDVVWKPEAFGSLSIDADEKSLIYSLVKSYNSRLTRLDDVIEGKGKGLIGLLSGPPGVGKTLSGEAVSEITKRPLFYLSAGDLGTTAEELDRNLNAILELCQGWGAVLLLDEADVFLQKREDAHIERNALVSIFLRQLEYFQGILILTTNRLNSFDPAFQSRIHFSISYPDLSMEARIAIWKTFLMRAGMDTESLFSDGNIEVLAKKDINGRQIKNAVKTALSIAEQQGEILGPKHIRIVLGVLEKWLLATTGS
ncbi:MAG: hypothetical protein MMC33_006875 [Icmadophila ericetorum]|nr:hypothetical protein [Icmadophila ericetorum]